jgi:hypothetical protein
MQGVWSGSGWAREAVQGPKETVRCRLSNAYDDKTRALTISGRCVVPGRKLTLSGEMRSAVGSDKISGFWFNPDGLGSVNISGVTRGNIVGFTFRARDPETSADIAQNVEWRVDGDRLHLRATDRAQPDIMMSDIVFTR